MSNPVDETEEAKKTLFVVKATERTLGFEIFLRNRGWDVVATHDLKQALSGLFRHKIHCVLIAVDHPNPKCLKLPGVIAQTLKVPMILFAESMSQMAMGHLRASTHPYIIAPPVSGPAIERMLLKIEKDQNAAPVESRDSTSGNISISGSNDANTAIHMQGKSTLEQMVHLFEGDESSGGTVLDRHAVNPGSALSATGSLAPPRLGGSPRSGESVPTNPRNALDNLKLPDGLGATNGGETASAKAHGAVSRQASKTNAQALHQTKASPNKLPKDSRSPKKHGRRPRTDEEMFEETSILILGVEQALKNASVQISLFDSPIQKIDANSRVACFEVTADSFSGAMILAFGSKHSTGETFSSEFKDSLLGYLENHGISVSMNEMPGFHLQNASLEEWSIDEAVFLRKSVHHDGEVVAAFFPHQQIDDRIHLSAEAHMSRLQLEEIRRDVHLEFDIYLYFPVNRKYIRYAAKGRNMFDTQRTRLEAGGVTDVHIRKENERDVTRYHVQNFLNDKIRFYKKRDDGGEKSSA